jgi:hypothetical protein
MNLPKKKKKSFLVWKNHESEKKYNYFLFLSLSSEENSIILYA